MYCRFVLSSSVKKYLKQEHVKTFINSKCKLCKLCYIAKKIEKRDIKEPKTTKYRYLEGNNVFLFLYKHCTKKENS